MAGEINKIVDRFIVLDGNTIREVVQIKNGKYFMNKTGKSFVALTEEQFNKMCSDIID